MKRALVVGIDDYKGSPLTGCVADADGSPLTSGSRCSLRVRRFGPKRLRFDRMSGLSAEQLDDLGRRVGDLLEGPWNRRTGRPGELTLREALVVSCGYARNNITEEVWAEIFDVEQSTISRYITRLTPLIDRATAEFRPTAEDATEATRDAIALVDGLPQGEFCISLTVSPCTKRP